MTGRIDFEHVCATASLRDVAGSVVGLRRAGREWTGCCPFHAEKSASFTIYEAGGRERYKCFGCGAAGDVVSFVARYYGIDTVEAVRHLTGGNLPSRAAPLAPPRDEAREKEERARMDRETAKARAVWTSATPGAGSPVETYLREARCIDIGRLGGVPASLRFARLPYWRAGAVGFERVGVYPAMVAPIQRAAGAMIGVHVTYLDPEGGGKLRLPDPDSAGKSLPAKKVRGTLAGGAIRLGPPTRHVYLAEGIETGLSVAVSVAGRKKGSVWTAISLGSGPIEIFTNQMIGDSLVPNKAGGKHGWAVLAKRQAVGEAGAAVADRYAGTAC